MKQKRVSFKAKVPAISAAPQANEAAPPNVSERDGWVSHGREDEAGLAGDAVAPAVAKPFATNDATFRIARLMPLWLGWYFIVATMAELLCSAPEKRGLQ